MGRKTSQCRDSLNKSLAVQFELWWISDFFATCTDISTECQPLDVEWEESDSSEGFALRPPLYIS
jgi:hypothetical protein